MIRPRDVAVVHQEIVFDRGNPVLHLVYVETLDGIQDAVMTRELGPFDTWIEISRPFARAVREAVH